MKRYLKNDMLRQLLTLFALISGLGLTATPAVAAQANVVSVAAAGETAACQPVTTQPIHLMREMPRNQHKRQGCGHQPVIIWTPTVQLQADRARE
jgi:hypothetical protein